MFDGFVHPGLVIGAALAAVPLLIHLLNRQRFKPLSWAAMRFVEAAWRKTRRRARLENLLLLLLRMAAIATRFPKLVLVPEHDGRGFAKMPKL